MFAMYRKMCVIMVVCAFCSFTWGGTTSKESPAKGTPTAPDKEQSPDVVKPVPWEIDEGLRERLEKNEEPEDVKVIIAFHRLIKKRMYLAEKKAPDNEISDVDVEILKTFLTVNPKRSDTIFYVLEDTWDGKDDYFKVFNQIFTQLERYRKHFRLHYGQLKAWEINLKGQYTKVQALREKKKQQEAARRKAPPPTEATPTVTPTESKSEK